jgi:RimJ/RimL family protein N-acetyltransferase
MQVDIRLLVREDYREIFEFIKRVEPFKGFQYYDQFCVSMDNRIGFTHWVGGRLVGVITYSDYFPGISVMLHAAFDKKFREAMNRKVIRNTFKYAFDKLIVHRITTYIIGELTDSIIGFIEKLGFIYEGTVRESVEYDGKFYNLKLYGMLRKDCRWI